jgi:methylenetetrahydrofolate dehydrogenase (NADP+)/methenyltetrahydrofolate cyclohydrolase
MALMLMQHEATVCICHAKTRDLAQFTLLADVLVVAAGYPNLILPQMWLVFIVARAIAQNHSLRSM